MLKKVKTAIKKYNMLDKGDRVVVAVSGGPDSMALLTCLDMISNEYGIELVAAHLNHGIREENADREEKFVQHFSQQLGIVFESKKINIPSMKKGTGKSIEEIAREERYLFLENVAYKYRANRIALGHQLQDQSETILMNFLRGSSSEGLKGMLPVRQGLFIRPLLGVNKAEILNFLEMENISYTLDTSNDSTLYLRNRIRHWLMPELKRRFNPNLDDSLGRMSEIMRIENDYMEKASLQMMDNLGIKLQNEEITVRISDLLNLHQALQNRIIKIILRNLTPHGKGIEYIHIKSAIELATGGQASSRVVLPFNIAVMREYDWLKFSLRKDRFIEPIEDISYTVSVPSHIHICELNTSMKFEIVERIESVSLTGSEVIYLDYEKIIPPLILRTVISGDRIQPSGMSGTKTLKKYFIDQKIPKSRRKKILVLADGESVIWIVGMRLSERVAVKKNSIKFLKVEIV